MTVTCVSESDVSGEGTSHLPGGTPLRKIDDEYCLERIDQAVRDLGEIERQRAVVRESLIRNYCRLDQSLPEPLNKKILFLLSV